MGFALIKKNNKKDMIWCMSFSYGRIVFKLLTKVIEFYLNFLSYISKNLVFQIGF